MARIIAVDLAITSTYYVRIADTDPDSLAVDTALERFGELTMNLAGLGPDRVETVAEPDEYVYDVMIDLDEDEAVGECAHCHKLIYSDLAYLATCDNCGQPQTIIPTEDK